MFASSALMMTGLNAQTILCVDRDFSDTNVGFADTWGAISRALDAAGYDYNYWEVAEIPDDGPPFDTLKNYDVVIWFSGESWQNNQTMSDLDEINLFDYLLDGGELFLNAQDYLWDKYNSAGTLDPLSFPYFALGLDEVVQDVYKIKEGSGIGDSARFYGLPGSLAEGLEFPVKNIFAAPTDDGLFGDSLAIHRGEGMMGLVLPYPSIGPAAIQYESATFDFRTVFSTIDIAAITDTVARDIYMHRVIEWLMYGIIGTSELDANDVNMQIGPNPVSDIVNIRTSYSMDEVWIFNNQGKMVRHEKVGQANVRMDLGDLAPGMYILKVKTDKGLVVSKILKQ